MEIKQLKYFIGIVDADFNMTKAAKQLYLTQSTLSQMINIFETNHQIQLFFRDKGRLVGLTPIGQEYYEYALKVTNLYDSMMLNIQKTSEKLNNVVRIGIPSITLRTEFSKLFINLKKRYKGLNIEMIEGGCQILLEQLENNDIDMAILTEPLQRRGQYEEHTIINDEFVVFMDRHHPLSKETELTWQQINQYEFTIFNHNFSTARYIMNCFEKHRISPNILMHSSSWEYLIDMVTDSEILTILPASTYDLMNKQRIIYKSIEKPLVFDIFISRKAYQDYPSAHEEVFQSIRNYCARMKNVK